MEKEQEIYNSYCSLPSGDYHRYHAVVCGEEWVLFNAAQVSCTWQFHIHSCLPTPVGAMITHSLAAPFRCWSGVHVWYCPWGGKLWRKVILSAAELAVHCVRIVSITLHHPWLVVLTYLGGCLGGTEGMGYWIIGGGKRGRELHVPQMDWRVWGSEKRRKGWLRELSAYNGVCCLRWSDLTNQLCTPHAGVAMLRCSGAEEATDSWTSTPSSLQPPGWLSSTEDRGTNGEGEKDQTNGKSKYVYIAPWSFQSTRPAMWLVLVHVRVMNCGNEITGRQRWT